jgi:galactonate dehydratase
MSLRTTGHAFAVATGPNTIVEDGMKITKIAPFLADRFLLVRVYTDSGIVGTGEAGLWAHHKTVYGAIQELSEYYVGQDPARIEHHAQVVTRDTHFWGAVLSAAISAIDVALWDILGKSLNRPIYQLLGGKCRDKIRVFANVWGRTLDQLGESATRQVAKGYTTLRATPFLPDFEKKTSSQVVGDGVAIVKAIRDAVGYDIDLGLEIHRNLEPEATITLARELEPYRILYYEDPLRPESIPAMEYVARHINLPIATGERLHSLYQFKELIDSKTCSLIRCDLSLAGGFTQAKKVAAMAEAAFIGYFPHLMGSHINTAAFMQLDAAIPNYAFQENNEGVDAFNDLFVEPLQRDGGYMIVPDRPGIGLELDESKLAKYPYKDKTITGFFHEDGSVAH